MIAGVWQWIDRTILDLGRQVRISYLPPLMVYLAAGISGLTGIVGTFFVKDYLALSAEFLAALGFWAGIPWVLKMPLGHIVDLVWRWKALLVFLGAGLIVASLAIMLGLLARPELMEQFAPVAAWYVTSALLAPVGYVIQDVVADAMTVEAVPRVDAYGHPIDKASERLMHTTMQTLGRVAIVGGGILVALANVVMFRNVEALPEAEKVAIYIDIYLMALIIPAVSVLGVALAGWLKRRDRHRLRQQGYQDEEVRAMLDVQDEPPAPNWWILGGGLAFVLFTLSVGLTEVPYNQEITFLGSLGIVVFLMSRLVRVLDPEDRRVLVGTALVIFIFRALPGPGAGATWWMIDELGFDQRFLSELSLIGSVLTLFGMFIFRRFMAERSIAYVIGFLTIASTLLSLPILGMYYGLHHWTAAHTGGVVDAHFIAVIDTALESPLGQIAMIPMLAWIARTAPASLKATFFAVMASFTNLALSLSQLGTKYLNVFFLVTREVRDAASGALTVPSDYSALGTLLVTVTILGLVLPFMAILFVKTTRFRSA
jgi:hypothetical protein